MTTTGRCEIHVPVHPPIADDQKSVGTPHQAIEFRKVGSKRLPLNLDLLAESGNEDGSWKFAKCLTRGGT
jgi:hypothetical protein